jgi:hypothetical protein
MTDQETNTAEVIARVTGSVSATYRVERVNEDGTRTTVSEEHFTREEEQT